jgi:quinol---cytochrome c reductase iron-sulfur subunit, bacillus type
MARSTDEDRRGVLKTIVVGGSAAFVAGVALPASRLALAPVFAAAHAGRRWIRIARLADLEDGESKRVPVIAEFTDAWTQYPREKLGAVWLLRQGDEIRALSVTCPHLGCSVEKSESGFGCPCHASVFDPGGKRISGPSPRDMDALPTRVVGEGAERVVEVRLQKYRQGIAEREEIE